MDELVRRLADGEHPVVAGRPVTKPAELKERIDRGYVFVRFTETRGGTEVGVEVDRAATDLSAAGFDRGEGRVHLEGTLVLNEDALRCVADLDLATLSGTGRLVPA